MVHRIIIAIVLLGAVVQAQPVTDYRQQRASISVWELEAILRADQPSRTLNEATPEELQRLEASPGGLLANCFNSRTVLRVGTSVFIIDMLGVSTLVCAAGFFILCFFTPFGMIFFRGGLHALVGTVLEGSGFARRLGRQLREAPHRHLQKEGSAREAFAVYMREDFIPAYKNNVTAIAFLGTAFLIFSIGLRGLKFMVPHQPGLIITAIIVEVTVLCLLGLTTWYEKMAEPATEPEPAVSTGDLRSEFVIERLEEVIRDLQETAGSEQALRGLDLVRAVVRKS